MPFDFGFVVETQATCFDDLNLTAISEDRVKQWRKMVLDEFAGRSRSHWTAVMRGQARWRSTYPIIAAWFANTHSDIGRSAPKDVKRLVAKIATALPGAQVSIDYFDKDPIVYIHHDGKKHCVAIWDKHVVHAIAGNAKLSRRQRFLRRFVKLA